MTTDTPQPQLGTIVKTIASQFTPALAVATFFSVYPPHPVVGDGFDGRVGYRDIDPKRVAGGIANPDAILRLIEQYKEIPGVAGLVDTVKSILGDADISNSNATNDQRELYEKAKDRMAQLATKYLPDALAALPPEGIASALKDANRSASDNTFLLDWAIRHDSAPLVTAILKSDVKLEIPHVAEAELDKEFTARATLELPAFLARQAIKTGHKESLAALTAHYGTDKCLKGLDTYVAEAWQSGAIPAVANSELEKALIAAETLGAITPETRAKMTEMGVKVSPEGKLPISNDASLSSDEIKIAGALIGKTAEEVGHMDPAAIATRVKEVTQKAILGK